MRKMLKKCKEWGDETLEIIGCILSKLFDKITSVPHRRKTPGDFVKILICIGIIGGTIPFAESHPYIAGILVIPSAIVGMRLLAIEDPENPGNKYPG